MPKVLLSLGSNVPPKKFVLQQAIAEVIKRDIGRVLLISPYYKTEPVGNTQQDWFVNNCILIETALEPLQLLEALQAIENDYGRIRKEKWGPRTLDIDIILFELSKEDQEKYQNHPDLKIPHPEMLNRAFVLCPMFDLMPWLVFNGRPLADLILETDYESVKLLSVKNEIFADILDMYWSVSKSEIAPGLNRMLYCAELLDNPHLKLPPVIHIAGTNGKGSTAAILQNILCAMGKKVHRFTSPHILSYQERFTFGLEGGARRFVTIEEFEICAARVAPYIEKCGLTHFEALTMMAFLFFSETPADYLILETGMGGRLDATNIVPKPAATIITTISRDHTEFLGDMIEEIAFEKAGIIKGGTPLIHSVQFPDAVKVIEDRAVKLKTKMYRINKEWSISEIFDTEDGTSIDCFTYKDEEVFLDLLSLRGSYQLENAGAAIATVIALLGDDHIPEPEIFDDGISTINWPARLEKLERENCKLPLDEDTEIIVDSAHNPEGLYSLLDYIQELNQVAPRENYMIISLKKGRDLSEIFTIISSFPDTHFIFIKETLTFDQCSADALVEMAETFELTYTLEENWEFFTKIFDDPDLPYKRYIVTGSIYFIGTFYRMIGYKIKP